MNNKLLLFSIGLDFIIIFIIFYKGLQNTNIYTPESKISYECILNQIVEIGDGKAGSGFIVIGSIVLFHISDDVISNDRIDIQKLNPIGRLAGDWYTRPTDNFKIMRKIKPDK